MKIDHWKLPHFFTKKLIIWIFLSKIWPVKADSFLSSASFYEEEAAFGNMSAFAAWFTQGV